MPGPQPTLPGFGIINNLDWIELINPVGLVDSVPVLNETTHDYEQTAPPPVVTISDPTRSVSELMLHSLIFSYVIDMWDQVAMGQATPDVIPIGLTEGSGFVPIGTLA